MRAAQYAERPDALFDAATLEDPHSLYASLRQTRPIARIGETGVHLVSTWDLVEEALSREEDFSANLTGVLIRDASGEPVPFPLPDSPGSHVIATADEPDHSVHRAAVQPTLAASRIAPLEPRVRAWAEAALRPLLEAGQGDFVPVAEEVPARAVAFVLGLPGDDVVRHRTWAMMGGDMLAGDVDATRLRFLATETAQMVEYLGAHLDAARPAPPDDPDATLLQALAYAVGQGRIDRLHAIGIAVVMFGAGGESTAALLGSVVRRLAEDPSMADRLREEPGLIARFVEEVARLEAPFQFHYRVVRRACELGGAALATGDRLMLLWASANRDATQFEDPDTLRLDRPHPKKHMSFGRGGHFCIGAPLARLEARVMLEELLTRTRRIALQPDAAPVHARSIFVRRLERLPLRLEAR